MGNYQYVATRVDLEHKLESCLGKTLGECDTARVFDRAAVNPKITGIAGDVVEQSILGYPPNSAQEPDLVVDGVEVELKATGVKVAKDGLLEAKEPMSITAVSVDKIVAEEFYSSKFWHKVERMLIVYYLYDSKTTVAASGYANFPIKGYQFHEFDQVDIERLEQDWQAVHNFIEDIEVTYPDPEERKKYYPGLSSKLRSKLMLIDTAPKYPNPPRFRLKRATVTSMVRGHFGHNLEQLPKTYTTFAAIDKVCHDYAVMHAGKTMADLAREFGVSVGAKNLAEQIIVRMFGGTSKKMNGIELFAKIGLQGKSVVLTRRGLRTEDTKLFTVDFDQFGTGCTFEDSQFKDYFSENQLLCMIFEEPYKDAPLSTCEFMGFKRIAFDDRFIEDEVKGTWDIVQWLITTGRLADVPECDASGVPKVNKTGVPVSAPNLPKSAHRTVFFRGSSSNSTKKPLVVNGVRMYSQQLWIKGTYIAGRLNSTKFI